MEFDKKNENVSRKYAINRKIFSQEIELTSKRLQLQVLGFM